MIRRTKTKRKTRPKNRKNNGTSVNITRKPSRWQQVTNRVDTSYKVLGHPYQTTKPVNEGKHYTVLAYTDWADTFVPTLIKWNHGEIDNLTNLNKSRINQQKAIHQVQQPAKAQRKIEGKWYTEHTGAYTKEEARYKAAQIRKQGYNARIIKTGNGYTVYAHQKQREKTI